MNAEASLKRRLGEAPDVASFGRAFQTMQENNLPFRRNIRLMFKSNDCRLAVYFVQLSRSRVAIFVQGSTPEIPSNGREVWISE